MTDQTDRLAQIAQRHTVTVTLSGDRSPYVPIYSFKCHSPEGAPCRQRCRNDDICEGMDIEGHTHDFYDSGECWMLGWWDNDDATPENLVEPFVLADLPVEGWWGDDCVEWKFAHSDLLDLVKSLTAERDALEDVNSKLRHDIGEITRSRDEWEGNYIDTSSELAALRAVVEEARAQIALTLCTSGDAKICERCKILSALNRGLKGGGE